VLRVTNNHGIHNSNYEDEVRLVGTYKGHSDDVMGVVEGDSGDTIITCSRDRSLKEWNKTTCECLRTYLVSSPVVSILKTRDNHSIVYGMEDGGVHFRRMSDFNITISFNLSDPVYNTVQLEDGSFVSGSLKILRWDDRGRVLQTFSAEFLVLQQMIELNSDLIVTSTLSQMNPAHFRLMVWRVASGQCIQTFACEHYHADLVKLSDDLFVSADYGHKIKVWSVKEGKLIETFDTLDRPTAMAKLKNGSIVLVGDSRFIVFHRRR